MVTLLPAAHVEGIYSCLDYYQTISDPFSRELLNRYDQLYPGSAKFTAGSACSGLYRGLRPLGSGRKRGRLTPARRRHPGAG
jgi:branched-chain amino acid transport system substrate-binding protein